jgi:hypothetical protein
MDYPPSDLSHGKKAWNRQKWHCAPHPSSTKFKSHLVKLVSVDSHLVNLVLFFRLSSVLLSSIEPLQTLMFLSVRPPFEGGASTSQSRAINPE